MSTRDNGIRIGQTDAPTVSILNPDGRDLLTIYPDGSVIGAVEDASEAARRFVEALRSELRRPPARVITTREELDGLPHNSIIRDDDGDAWQKYGLVWNVVGIRGDELDAEERDGSLISYPATVLWEGDA